MVAFRHSVAIKDRGGELWVLLGSLLLMVVEPSSVFTASLGVVLQHCPLLLSYYRGSSANYAYNVFDGLGVKDLAALIG
ncbi:hypothetical protein RJT34_16699 [Clitoria ternatea]|uniref:Uncharacterized protein n=1 Tax=Clitoria ternatea TaxID=43366 RepID=A0AAN9PDW6_CLITE